MDKPGVGVVAIIWRNNKILIGRRISNDKRNGLWVFPGGKLEFGETMFDGLVREIKEETGLDIDHAFIDALVEYIDDDQHWILQYYQVTQVTGDPVVIEPDKQHEWVWMSIDEISKLNIGGGDKIYWQQNMFSIRF